MNGFHIALALPLLVVGWFGLHFRKSVLGGAAAVLITWQGMLCLAVVSVFQKATPAEGTVLLWIMIFGSLLSFASILVLGLRRYYLSRDVTWKNSKEVEQQ
jgi:hypothetical protein